MIYFPGGGGCSVDPEEPAIHSWGQSGSGYGAEVFGGSDCAEAGITTEAGNTVSVLTVRGYGYAEWPADWGEPQAVDFYNADGEPLATLEFPLESNR